MNFVAVSTNFITQIDEFGIHDDQVHDEHQQVRFDVVDFGGPIVGQLFLSNELQRPESGFFGASNAQSHDAG